MITIRAFEDYLTRALVPFYEEPEAAAMAGLVAEHLLGQDRLVRSQHRDQPVPAEVLAAAEPLLSRLQQHEPLQYVLGTAHFYGLELHVTPAVLIPRPETEELVQLIIRDHASQPDLRVLDIGTGSGCIPIALAVHLRTPKVWAVDISLEALAVARKNAEQYQVAITWLQADILADPLDLSEASLDLVVSNPPYVLETEKQEMRQNVLAHEPHLALFVPNADPLLFYNVIIAKAWDLLRPGGRLYLEINERFGLAMSQAATRHGFGEVEVLQDFFGKDRFLRARKVAVYS